MDVTPYLYTEGKYNTRLEQLRDLPKGKCMIHFETVDMKKAKEIVGGNSCIVGNLSAYLLEMGTPEQVTEEVKKLLDICMCIYRPDRAHCTAFQCMASADTVHAFRSSVHDDYSGIGIPASVNRASSSSTLSRK